MTLLARVDWPALLRRLLDDADDELLERAYGYAVGRSAISAPVAVFACLLCGSPGRFVDRALLDVGGLDANAAILTRFWLQDQAHVVFTAAGDPYAAPPEGDLAAPGVLLLDPDLEWLPLLDLAADVARSGGLAVDVGPLRPGLAGCYSPSLRRITLDLAQRADERTWAHELGHVLDPMLGRRQAFEVDERFADELGALLLAARPTTVQAAQPVIEECLTRTDSEPGRYVGSRGPNGTNLDPGGPAGLPEPGVASLVAFLALPLGVGARRSPKVDTDARRQA